jgi:hypothetical protein
MRRLHQRVVDDDGKVVLRAAVRSDEHEIADHVAVEDDLAADQIPEPDLLRLGHLEADDRALARVNPHLCVLTRERSARPVILGRPAGGKVLMAIAIELGRRAEAVIRVVARHQLVRVRRIQVHTLGLTVWSVRPADIRTLVPLEAEPSEILEDAALRFPCRSLGVGILDAQDECSVLAVREQPVEQRRAGVAHVQLTGGAGSKSNAHTSVGSRQSAARQQHHRVGGNGLAAPNGVNALVRFGLDADLVARQGERRRQLLFHRGAMRCEFRSL